MQHSLNEKCRIYGIRVAELKAKNLMPLTKLNDYNFRADCRNFLSFKMHFVIYWIYLHISTPINCEHNFSYLKVKQLKMKKKRFYWLSFSNMLKRKVNIVNDIICMG